jgi:hypothetical protein
MNKPKDYKNFNEMLEWEIPETIQKLEQSGDKDRLNSLVDLTRELHPEYLPDKYKSDDNRNL